MADLNKLIERMRYWCQTANLGYDQSNRQDFRDGGETDCSALVIHALQEAGFDTGSATYTGNMRSNLAARGWQVVANDGNPKAGDILLNDNNHVAVYLGNNQVAQASGDENGNASGGQGGDQTGRETAIVGYYNYPWDCYLRSNLSGTTSTTTNTMEDDDLMKFTYDILDTTTGKSQGTVYYFNGNKVIALTDLDQLNIVRSIYKDTVGKELRHYQWQTSAPWYARFLQANNQRTPEVAWK